MEKTGDHQSLDDSTMTGAWNLLHLGKYTGYMLSNQWSSLEVIISLIPNYALTIDLSCIVHAEIWVISSSLVAALQIIHKAAQAMYPGIQAI